MSHGPYDGGEVASQQDGAVAAAPIGDAVPRTLPDALAQIDTLRSINARLVQRIRHLQRSEAQALRLADRDGLTGLYNRRKMLELLEGAVANAAQCRQHLGLLFIDLDGFKKVNDEHGHAMGDRLLMTVASRIAGRTRSGDFVCRYGGDEFIVILPGAADRSAMREVADSIARRVALPYRIDGTELRVTASIGLSHYPDAAASAAELLQRADQAMYRAKAQGSQPEHSAVPARRRDDFRRPSAWE